VRDPSRDVNAPETVREPVCAVSHLGNANERLDRDGESDGAYPDEECEAVECTRLCGTLWVLSSEGTDAEEEADDEEADEESTPAESTCAAAELSAAGTQSLLVRSLVTEPVEVEVLTADAASSSSLVVRVSADEAEGDCRPEEEDDGAVSDGGGVW
jgi:hypothetical protein